MRRPGTDLGDNEIVSFNEQDWKRDGPYQFIGPDGWEIANVFVNTRPRWMLRHDGIPYGAFSAAWEAMEHHAALSRRTDTRPPDTNG